MEKRRFAGRHLMVWGALFLLAWAGYEFCVRGEVIWWAVRGLYNLCIHENIPFARALSYYDYSMFAVMAYLLALVLFSLVVVCARNKPRSGYLIIPLAAGLCAYGGVRLNIIQFNLLNWLQALKMLPVLLVIVGAVVNLCQLYRARTRRRKQRDPRLNRNRQMAEQVRRRKKYTEAV